MRLNSRLHIERCLIVILVVGEIEPQRSIDHFKAYFARSNLPVIEFMIGCNLVRIYC
jgi:hypothetical protein